MRKALFTLLLLLAGGVPVLAQSTAFRYIVGEMHKVYDRPAFDNYCMGIGLDHSFNNRLTIGLDVTYDIAGALRAEDGKAVNITSGAATSSYFVTRHLLSLNYHTEYALAENDGTHGYIGTFIGLRHISQEWRDDAYYDEYTVNPFPSRLSVSQWLIPIGLRFGVRGPVDAGFLDLYAQLGYQVGGGKDLYSKYRVLSKAEFTHTSALAFSLGLAYGFGW